MSSAAIYPNETLGHALHRRGDPMSPSDFLDVLDEIGTLSSEPLTPGEHAFLLQHTDNTEGTLTDTARMATRVAVARNSLAIDHDLVGKALTTSDVAKLLGRAESNVRRSQLSSDLYAMNPGDRRGLRFPRWQFTEGGQVIPGLRRILPVFPRNMHPAAIERYMSAANEALDDLSPIEWLAAGGAADAVVELVDDLGYV